MSEDYGDASPYNYTLNNPVNNTDPDGMSVDVPVGIRNDYNFGPDGKLDNVVIKPGPDHFYQTDKDGKTSELNGNQLTPEMSAQYLKKNAELGTNLEEVAITAKIKPVKMEFPLYIGARGLISGIPRLIKVGQNYLMGRRIYLN